MQELEMTETVNSVFQTTIHQWMSLSSRNRPVIIGINGPQGCGKTTLTRNLVATLPFKVIAISLDDFYIPYQDQKLLASNPLLKYRGLPGTHDIKLALTVLQSLQSGCDTIVPRFDKLLNHGMGDRLPESQWVKVAGAVDIILFEGWCLGFKSLDKLEYDHSSAKDMEIKFSLADIQVVNESLKSYEPIYRLFDYFAYIESDELANIYKWRWQQELTMTAIAGNDFGMSKIEVKDFVDRFMPAYKIFAHTVSNGLGGVRSGRFLKIDIDIDRAIKSFTVS